MRVARFQISNEYLAKILKLPESAKIELVTQCSNTMLFEVIVSDENLDDIENIENIEDIPLIKPLFEITNNGDVKFLRWKSIFT